jgi:hypothetical protein
MTVAAWGWFGHPQRPNPFSFLFSFLLLPLGVAETPLRATRVVRLPLDQPIWGWLDHPIGQSEKKKKVLAHGGGSATPKTGLGSGQLPPCGPKWLDIYIYIYSSHVSTNMTMGAGIAQIPRHM